MEVYIKKILELDIEKIVEIHNAAFENFFLTELGPSFLKTYYRSVFFSNDGVFLKAVSAENKILGFCAATKLSAGFNFRIIKNNFYAFLFHGIKMFFSNPKKLLHIMKNFKKTNVSVNDDKQYAELLSIATLPQYQGAGIGKKLLCELEHYVDKETIISLTTDSENNNKAINFYKRCGYEIWYDFITYPDRKMYRMVKKI